MACSAAARSDFFRFGKSAEFEQTAFTSPIDAPVSSAISCCVRHASQRSKIVVDCAKELFEQIYRVAWPFAFIDTKG